MGPPHRTAGKALGNGVVVIVVGTLRSQLPLQAASRPAR